MARRTIGEQELQLLQDLVENGPGTVGDVALRFGAPRGLARSTVLTVMERLREKGYLRRRRVDGVFRYDSPLSAAELLRGVVRSFVEKSLGGSVTPFVSYLAEGAEVSDSELAQLEGLVKRLKSKRRES